MTELKPCPFCGGKAKWNGGLGNYVTLTCRICGAYLEERVTATINKMPEANLEDAENRLIEKWNTRYYPAEVQQAIDRMKPHKVIIYDDIRDYGGCATCGNIVNTDYFFCPECGQALDWNE